MMTNRPSRPTSLACTLAAGDLRQRRAWIARLNRDALRSAFRDGLRLELTYSPTALNRVQKLVVRERDCCASLTFDLQQDEEAVRLVIEAPESAHHALDAVFESYRARARALLSGTDRKQGATVGQAGRVCTGPRRRSRLS